MLVYQRVILNTLKLDTNFQDFDLKQWIHQPFKEEPLCVAMTLTSCPTRK